jgi:hypothetical protein
LTHRNAAACKGCAFRVPIVQPANAAERATAFIRDVPDAWAFPGIRLHRSPPQLRNSVSLADVGALLKQMLHDHQFEIRAQIAGSITERAEWTK